jgi:hypothetical protein
MGGKAILLVKHTIFRPDSKDLDQDRAPPLADMRIPGRMARLQLNTEARIGGCHLMTSMTFKSVIVHISYTIGKDVSKYDPKLSPPKEKTFTCGHDQEIIQI